MERKRKRSLLARIEGQVFALECGDTDAGRHTLQRITWLINALRGMPQDDVERDLCRRLERRIVALRDAMLEGQPEKLFTHRRTLARSDCVLWQLRLRRPLAEEIGSREE